MKGYGPAYTIRGDRPARIVHQLRWYQFREFLGIHLNALACREKVWQQSAGAVHAKHEGKTLCARIGQPRGARSSMAYSLLMRNPG
ncbi:MAG: hypothetical protein CSA33_00580 [Desulfobulbus propionicus]|nr:MAG: hypothetical protein CSA33_00580 [Desulfobulbus propionicus]